jgi:hypothetical protein
MDHGKSVQEHKCNQGWICEQHPDQGWPHDECTGPGMPCPVCQRARAREQKGRPFRATGHRWRAWIAWMKTKNETVLLAMMGTARFTPGRAPPGSREFLWEITCAERHDWWLHDVNH